MANAKVYTIEIHRRGRVRETSGTLKELIEYFSYTLEVGHSWEHERGNHKISLNPRTIQSLVNNLNWAVDNSAANGCGSEWFTLKEA